MATLNLGALAPPAFLTRNYHNSDCYKAGAISVLSGAAFVPRAFDMTGSGWSSQDSDDTVTEYYDVTLYDGMTPTAQLVDTIYLWGLNAKTFTVRWYYNGTQVSSVSKSNYASAVCLVTLDDGAGKPVLIDRVRIEMTTTQTANQDKTLNIYLGALILQPPMGMFDYKPQRMDGISTIVMADKTLRETAVYRSASSFEMWKAKMGFRKVPQSLRDQFKALKKVRPLVVLPEPGEIPTDIFQARIAPNGYNDQYLTIAKSSGYIVMLDVEEMGGA